MLEEGSGNEVIGYGLSPFVDIKTKQYNGNNMIDAIR
jgi:hypothetical protein